MGTCYLTQFPNYTNIYLAGPPVAVSFLLTLFSIGITLGALLCDKLSCQRIEPGLVPIGAIGITFFGIRLSFSTPTNPSVTNSLEAFVFNPELFNVFIDLLMVGIFAGIFIVPLYAMMQHNADESERSQVIAAHNIYSSLFMVISAALASVALGVIGMSITDFFFYIAVINLFAMLYVCKHFPVFMLRFMVWMLSHSLYRVKHQGLENIPEKGGVLLVCNHVSYVDALLLGGACPRPIRFVMWADYTKIPMLRYFFKASRVIPISQNRKTILNAFSEVKKQLEAGEVVCIFPEGELTQTGELNEFKRGIDIVLKQSPVPVVPMAINGLWGSFFSREGGRAMLKRPKRFWSKISIVAGLPVPAIEANSNRLYQDVQALLVKP